MGLLDALFGRKRLPASKPDRLGAITAAELTVRTELGCEPANQAALVVRTVAASEFERARSDLERMLELAGRDLGSRTSVVPDEYGYIWVIVEDPDFPDLVAATQVAAQTLAEEGFRDQLLCAVYPFIDAAGRPLHLIYSFKRGTFYAFAPRDGRQRDLALELRAHATLDHELPLERDLQYRFPLWGIPLGGSRP